ncbi:MAG: SDR family oxidoreductase [Sphingomonadales bacterium]|nr:SDR family oxidoreductase [Sphingomonadales bacterium]
MNRTIVITGAGEGLGRALARRLAADGETIVLLGRTLAKLDAVIAEIGGGAHLALACDVGDPDAVRAAFAAIAARFSRIDVLINNAAVYEPFSLAEAEDAKILVQAKTNLLGPIWCARAAVPLLRASDGTRGGHLVNISSESVHLRMPMLWMYAGTKAGLEYMTREWARDLAPDGIRVSLVSAGMMYDESKTANNWPPEAAMRFVQENHKVGLPVGQMPISHYDSAAEAIRAILNTPADINMGYVQLAASRP